MSSRKLYNNAVSLILIVSLNVQYNTCAGKNIFDEPQASCNFIIRWAFAKLCNHFYDPNTVPCSWPTKPQGISFHPSDINETDVIFVRNTKRFFSEMHPHINHPYIILTHGDYRDTCDENFFHYLDDPKIIAWLSIHPFKKAHKKFVPLPLGIRQEHAYFENKEIYNEFFKNLREQASKDKLLCLNFDPEKNQLREAIIEKFSSKPWCCRQEKLPFIQYMKEMSTYKFVFSPRGWGPDSYRTWEALLVGTIPIVKRGEFEIIDIVKGIIPESLDQSVDSQLDTLYANLPVLLIDDWANITEEFLKQKYIEMTKKNYDLASLYMEYWVSKIDAIKEHHYQDKIDKMSIFSQLRKEHSEE